MEENKGFPYRRFVIILSLLAVLTVLGVASYASLRLGIFTVEEIEISGNNRISEREIIKRSGLHRGLSSIFFFENQVEEDILGNPWIRTVSVNKEFPKKVRIEIEEEEVYCIVISGGGKPFYISRSGNMLGSGNFDMGLDFPVLIGEVIENPDLLKEALDILELSKSSIVLNWNDISEVHIDPIYGIKVFTNDNRRIEFDRNKIVEKWDKIEKILKHSDSLGLKEYYINISSENMGVVNFQPPSASSGAKDG
ncbi:MAG: FtsQ-type POTRA domain-containing protein [Deltaproteobacteria bacterium]